MASERMASLVGERHLEPLQRRLIHVPLAWRFPPLPWASHKRRFAGRSYIAATTRTGRATPGQLATLLPASWGAAGDREPRAEHHAGPHASRRAWAAAATARRRPAPGPGPSSSRIRSE